MDEIKNSETQEIINLANAIRPAELVTQSQGYIKRYALPPGWSDKIYDEESLLSAPARKKGTVRLDEQDSFIAYINRHKMTDLTTIYCQADYRQSKVDFDCVINDHQGANDGQQWRDHRALYTPVFSEEWKRWSGGNKQQHSQVEFASFVEENLADIASVEGMPSGKELLEMAISFEANQDKRYKSSIRLQSGGVQLNFVEDDDAQTLQQMKLFEKISIGIPVFWNGTAYRIDARLRYRVTQGVLKFWYELIRPDKVIEDATKTMIEKIKSETGVPLYFGKI
ncbi:DUF2303 family protein [Nitrosomonas oligotropha]|uniref:DUF2303 family protein n=1 Tax=Nitrosomonas oligotropha TaxID=42354 RepID=UPI001372246F|nr:DUF2303 family protein [Nitrosomonas oligotropha]MXS84328.1 DUF2303 family protein [Nitrosomonas oligotropha]